MSGLSIAVIIAAAVVVWCVVAALLSVVVGRLFGRAETLTVVAEASRYCEEATRG